MDALHGCVVACGTGASGGAGAGEVLERRRGSRRGAGAGEALEQRPAGATQDLQATAAHAEKENEGDGCGLRAGVAVRRVVCCVASWLAYMCGCVLCLVCVVFFFF